MTLVHRLDRLASHWPHPADVLAARLIQEFQVASPRSLESSTALYHRSREVMANAGLSEAAKQRALRKMMIGVGFPEDGVRQCLAKMPVFYALAFACLGPSQVSDLHYLSESGRDRLRQYLDELFTPTEHVVLNELARRITQDKAQ